MPCSSPSRSDVSPVQRRRAATAARVAPANGARHCRARTGEVRRRMRVRGLGRIGAGLAVAAGVAGGSAGSLFHTYAPPIAVTLITVGCHTTYEVYENTKERLIMVRDNVGV